MKTELTVEQSQLLIELGVPKEKASAFDYMDSGKSVGGVEMPPIRVPVFNLEDFLNGEILPKIIVTEKGNCSLRIKYVHLNDKIQAEVCYPAIWDFPTYLNHSPTYFKEELIDALYELACWYYGKYLKSEEI